MPDRTAALAATLRRDRALAPWLHAALCMHVARYPSRLRIPRSPASQEWIARALLPLLDTLPPEQAEVLRLTDLGALTRRWGESSLGWGGTI